MAGFFKRLLGNNELIGDLAAGDWSPVPAYAAASGVGLTSLFDEAPPTPRPPRPRQRRRSLRFLGFLSREERTIVERQQAAPQNPRPLAAPAAPAAPAAGGDDWVGVLRSYGEHLTDDELAIIRKQLKR
jgi:hypothetical protein